MTDEDTGLEEDDIVLFIGNAGPNFKSLLLIAPCRTMCSENRDEAGYNFFEGALQKCHSIERLEPFTLIILDLNELHKNSCIDLKGCSCHADYDLYYNEISPSFYEY